MGILASFLTMGFRH